VALRNLQLIRQNLSYNQLEQATGMDFIHDPTSFPVNPLTGKNNVHTIATPVPSDPGDLTPGGGGWIYSSSSQNVWIDTAGYLHH
jgi:hypothetical protein